MRFAVVVVLLLSQPALAEAPRFATPVEGLSPEITLIARDGRELQGQVRRFESDALWMMGDINPGVARIQFEDVDGNREWFEAEAIVRLVVKLSWLQRSDILDEHTSSIVRFVTALEHDFSEVREREYTYYEPVETKPGKHQLYQLINPGFDGKIKVFAMGEMTFFPDESQYSEGISVDGVEITSPQLSKMLVAKSGKVMVVKKGKYKKKYFSELYGDCDAMQQYAEEDRKFKYFAEHVFVYDQVCE